MKSLDRLPGVHTACAYGCLAAAARTHRKFQLELFGDTRSHTDGEGRLAVVIAHAYSYSELLLALESGH